MQGSRSIARPSDAFQEQLRILGKFIRTVVSYQSYLKRQDKYSSSRSC
jgi:hypothetical protein